MITEPYTHIRSNGEKVEYIFEYHEADNFDHLPIEQCRQVRAVTYDPQLRVCFVQHSGSGLWGHPGGTIEPGESPHEALVRELVEETNTRLVHAIPIGYQRVIRVDSEHPDVYQLRYVAIVEKIGDYTGDPDCSTAVCQEIAFSDIPHYVMWNRIGEKIYEQAGKILKI